MELEFISQEQECIPQKIGMYSTEAGTFFTETTIYSMEKQIVSKE